MANNTSDVLDYKDPGSISKELLDMPGFVNELKNYTLSTSHRANEPLAFAGALAMLAHLTGRSYMDETGLHSNLYLIALAPTTMGKEAPRDTNKILAERIGVLASLPDSVASGEALEDAVSNSPSLLLQCDEVDTMLGEKIKGQKRASRLNEMLLRFFTEAKCGHAMRLKANDGGRTKIILMPHLTLFATGIPQYVYGALTERSITNGLLGRCIFIDANEFVPLGEVMNTELPQLVVETGAQMVKREQEFSESGVFRPEVVTLSADGSLAKRDLRSKIDKVSLRCFDNGLSIGFALYGRIYEKAMKLAMLRAISREPLGACITGDDVCWATKFTLHTTSRMLYEAQFNISEGGFDRLKKRFLGMLAKNGGKLDHSTLLRNLPIDAPLFHRLVQTLLMSDLIEDEAISGRKVMYSLKNVG